MAFLSKVLVEKVSYKGWENCIKLSNGVVELIVTIDVGPRLISFAFNGGENEFCEVENQVGTTGGDDWKIYGGHRLWHSPEAKPRCYEPDNAPVKWKKKKNGIILIQNMEPWTQIKKEIEITMSVKKAKVRVLHRITNMGAWPIELSVWALTVMATGGKQIIPEITEETGLLPNRTITLWPYTKMNDPRVTWGEKYIMLDQNDKMSNAFKIGLPNDAGWAAYANHGHLFVKKYKHIVGAKYPDNGASYETYTTDFMMEMETLSPLTSINPETSIEHEEVWYLYDHVEVPENEADIEAKILPLIR